MSSLGRTRTGGHGDRSLISYRGVKPPLVFHLLGRCLSAQQSGIVGELGNQLTLNEVIAMLSSPMANEAVLDPSPAIIHVQVAGEIDTASAPMLDRALAPRAGVLPVLIVVDLREVTFLGIAGLVVLAETREWAHRTGTRLQFISGGPAVRRALSLLDTVLPVCDRCPQ